MIRLQGLGKRFGPITALEDVSVSIRPGVITALAGPNGSGKTTLIKSILGMVKVDRGHIEFQGAVLNGHHAYRRQIGYMPQEGHFPENLRISEVIDLVRSVRGASDAPDTRLLTRLHLDREMRKRIRTLSGGTRQRLSAAIAFMFRSELLILDEPTAGLDPISCGILKEEILAARESGKTIVISSHIPNDLEELADEIVFLLDGRPVFSGSKKELAAATGEAGIERSFAALMRRNGA